MPRFADFAVAPGAVAHKTHQRPSAVPAAAVVAHASGPGGTGGFETWSVAPGAESPLGQNTLVAACADMAETAAGVEVIATCSAEGADGHGLSDRFAAVNAAKEHRKDLFISVDKGVATKFLPVGFFSGGQVGAKPVFDGFGHGLEQSVEHLLGIGKSSGWVDGQSPLE